MLGLLLTTHNGLPWQRPFKNLKKSSRSIICTKALSYSEKVQKSVRYRPEKSLTRKRKKLTQAKHAERANKLAMPATCVSLKPDGCCHAA